MAGFRARQGNVTVELDGALSDMIDTMLREMAPTVRDELNAFVAKAKAYVAAEYPRAGDPRFKTSTGNSFDAFSYIDTYSADPDREAWTRGLGSDFQIMHCGIKRWPVGAPVQGPLHVLYELMREHKFTAADVEKLVVRIPERELGVVNRQKMSDISVQYLMAVMLLDGTVSFAAAHTTRRMKDPRIAAVRQRIEAVGDATLTDPLRRWRSVVEIKLKDGRAVTGQTLAAKGTFENPLTRPEVEEKALDLMAPMIGKARSLKLMAALFDIENLDDMRRLRRLYVI